MTPSQFEQGQTEHFNRGKYLLCHQWISQLSEQFDKKQLLEARTKFACLKNVISYFSHIYIYIYIYMYIYIGRERMDETVHTIFHCAPFLV